MAEMWTASNTARTRRRWKRVVLRLIVLLAAAAAAGALYERYAVERDARRYSAPGQYVAAGGRQLHVVCIGRGAPLVLFEQSGFSNSTSFLAARSGVAQHTRVCTYDRMGVGWSDAGPSEITAGMLAEDLRRVSDATSRGQPLILVASSIGGVTAELFARTHPERVAGIVFLDAGNSQAIAEPIKRDIPMLLRGPCGVVRAAGAIGLMRLLDPWNLRGDRTETGARAAALMYGAKPWLMLCAMVRGAQATAKEFADAPPLPREIPITALIAETAEGLVPPALAHWVRLDDSHTLRESLQRITQGSAHGVWRVVPGSGHLIASSQPQAVVDAVLEMIRDRR